jgi:ribose transport system substrate-binding protein
MRKIILLSALAGLTMSLAGCGGSSGRSDGQKLTIAVIPKGTSHEFWQSIHAGALQAEAELNAQGTPVSIIWKGPLREDDREQQIQVVEAFIAQGVNGIVLAPLDSRALARPVEEAKRAGLPTIIIDSDLESKEISSFVATDNRKGGMLAADRLGELLGGKGKVMMLRYQEGSASTHDREEGFLAEIKAKYPQIELISADQYAGATRDTAKRASENLLNRYGDDVQGVFTPNESTTAGMLLALQDIGKAGKVKFVGFDASDSFIKALNAKQLDGFVIQNPFKMGYLGVMLMVAHLQGKPIEQRIDTGVMMVTAENLNSSEAQTMMNPPKKR